MIHTDFNSFNKLKIPHINRLMVIKHIPSIVIIKLVIIKIIKQHIGSLQYVLPSISFKLLLRTISTTNPVELQISPTNKWWLFTHNSHTSFNSFNSMNTIKP